MSQRKSLSADIQSDISGFEKGSLNWVEIDESNSVIDQLKLQSSIKEKRSLKTTEETATQKRKSTLLNQSLLLKEVTANKK